MGAVGDRSSGSGVKVTRNKLNEDAEMPPLDDANLTEPYRSVRWLMEMIISAAFSQFT